MNPYIGYAACLAATLVVTVGDYFVKKAADAGLGFTSWQFLLAFAFYASSSVLWLVVLRHVSLAQMGVAFSAFSLLLLVAMGVILFGEKLALREYLGIACAIAAMVLMSRTA